MPRSNANRTKIAAIPVAAFSTFLEYTPPARLSRNLRKMMIAWLMTGQDSTPPYYEDLLHDLNNLFELLDVAENRTP